MEKISKIAKVLDKLVKIIFGFTAIGGGVVVVMFIFAAIFENTSFVSEGVPSLTLGVVNFEFAKDYQLSTGDSIRNLLLANSISLIVTIIYICIICRQTRTLLQPMATGSPFDTMVSASLKKLSWVILIGGGITSVVNMIVEILTMSMYNLQELFINDKIIKCNIEYIFDCTFIEIFAVLYLLSLVFKYGEELQKQSDETL